MEKRCMANILKRLKSINKDYVDMYIKKCLNGHTIHIYLKSYQESQWWDSRISYLLCNDGFVVDSAIYSNRPRKHRNTKKMIQCHEVITYIGGHYESFY